PRRHLFRCAAGSRHAEQAAPSLSEHNHVVGTPTASYELALEIAHWHRWSARERERHQFSLRCDERDVRSVRRKKRIGRALRARNDHLLKLSEPPNGELRGCSLYVIDDLGAIR